MPAPKDPEKRKLWIQRKSKKRPDMVGDLNPAKRPDVRRKMSDNHNGQGFTGKKHSDDTIIKMKKSHEGRFGEESRNWTGGNADYWASKMKEIYKECVLDGRTERLEMHHIDGNRDNNERFNRVILCSDCHHFWHNN